MAADECECVDARWEALELRKPCLTGVPAKQIVFVHGELSSLTFSICH
jgi:hypothetical protein